MPKQIRDCFDVDYPPELDKYISNYNINVFEMAYLPDETVNMLKYDMHFLADMLSQLRKTGNFVPSEDSDLKHPESSMEILSDLIGDKEAIEVYNRLIEEEGGEEGMNEWIKDWRDNLLQEGREQGLEQGIEGTVSALKRNSFEKNSVKEEIAKTYSLSPDVAAQKVEKYWA